MTDPAGTQPADTADPRHGPGGLPQFLADGRLDTIQRAGEHGTRRLPDDAEDHHCDDEPDDRVGQREAQPDTRGAEHHGKAGQPVDAGMVTVGDERRALDLAADADAEHGDDLVADETEHPGRCHDAEHVDLLRVDQPVDRLVAGDQRAEQNQADDDHAGKVLDAAEAIGETRRRLAPGEGEGDPERDGGGRIADIVDGVGEQGHAAAQQDNDDLQNRGDGEDGERPLDRPDAARGGGDGRVDDAVGMAMPPFVVGVAMGAV